MSKKTYFKVRAFELKNRQSTKIPPKNYQALFFFLKKHVFLYFLFF